MQSTQISFISQLKGKLTLWQYKCATIFVDHYLRYHFAHLQETLSSADTIDTKEAFPLSGIQGPWEFLFANIIVTMADFLTMISYKALNRTANALNFVVSMLTFKMAFLKDVFVI